MTTHLSARVIKEFVIQGGALDGSGDEAVSSYEGFFADEVHRGLYHFNGALALGDHGPHTNGNQFFGAWRTTGAGWSLYCFWTGIPRVRNRSSDRSSADKQ